MAVTSDSSLLAQSHHVQQGAHCSAAGPPSSSASSEGAPPSGPTAQVEMQPTDLAAVVDNGHAAAKEPCSDTGMQQLITAKPHEGFTKYFAKPRKTLDENTKFATKLSKARLEKLPIVINGYQELFRYIFFVVIFFSMLALQTNPTDSFALVSQLKQTLIQTEGALVADVRSMESLFKFLVGTLEEKVVEESVDPLDEEAAAATKKKKKKKKKGAGGGGVEVALIPTFFPAGYYNDPLKPKPATSDGYVLDKNALLGGVTMLQERFKRFKCSGSPYSEFYQTCVADSDTLDTAPFGADNQWTYDPGYNAHVFFLSMPEGMGNVEKVKNLRIQRWFDRSSKALVIKFAVYNRCRPCYRLN
jgi:hypothetical protein